MLERGFVVLFCKLLIYFVSKTIENWLVRLNTLSGFLFSWWKSFFFWISQFWLLLVGEWWLLINSHVGVSDELVRVLDDDMLNECGLKLIMSSPNIQGTKIWERDWNPKYEDLWSKANHQLPKIIWNFPLIWGFKL